MARRYVYTRISMCRGIDWADLLSQIFYDPAKRNGSPDDELGDMIARFRPDEGLVGDQTNVYKTFHLARYAVNVLFPGAAITEPLDSVLRNLDFIGASNFFHSFEEASKNKGTLKLSALYQTIMKNRKETYAEMNVKLANLKLPPKKEAQRRLIYERSIFTIRWTMRVLRQAFGVELIDESDKGGEDITFTPYNGISKDHEFSWTLGTAVLLASRDPKDLKAAVPAMRAEE